MTAGFDPEGIGKLFKFPRKYLFHISIFSIIYNILSFSSPIYMLQIYNRIIPTRSEESLFWLTVLIVLLFLLMSALDAIRSLIFIYISRDFKHYLSRRAFENHLRFRDASVRDPRTPNDPLNDVQKISDFLSRGYISHFLDTLWFPMFVIALYLLHPLFALLAVIGASWLGLLAFVSHALVSLAAANGGREAKRHFVGADEIRENAELIISLGMITNVVRRWELGHLQSFDHQNSLNERLALIAAAGKTSRLLIQSLALGVGAYLAINNAVSAGAIVASSILVGRALTPIEAVIAAWNKLSEAKGSYQRLLQLIDSDQAHDRQLATLSCNGDLSVDQLTVTDGRKVVFRNLSFDAAPGKIIAIVGPSGAGKSILAKHLIGVCRSSEGVVRLDGADVSSISNNSRLQRIGYMPEAASELSGTIVDHIGRFGAFTAEDILQAASLTDANEMILKLPDGYGTKIGRHGCYLSSSQRQILNLTRACCGLPSLIVLDEPSANLDEAGERSLYKTMDELQSCNITLCIVTNKTALIRKADLIVVLNMRGETCIGRPDDILTPQIRAVAPNRTEIKSTK